MIMINIKFNSDDELLLNKTKNIPSMLLELFFKYYPQVFLDECLYKI